MQLKLKEVKRQFVYENEWFDERIYAMDAVKRYSNIEGWEIRKNKEGIFEFKSIKSQCDDLKVEVTFRLVNHYCETITVTIWQD